MQCFARSGAASRRGTARSSSPGSTSAASATATAGYTLARLVREAGETPGLARLRLSSIEINHVDDELVSALRETPNVARHLHVPLQSGDDGVLRAMGRRYSAATYLRRLASLDDFNLTADVIVGFPTEDERAFANTLRVVREARLTKLHVFPYSPRPGTKTADDDPVPAAREEGAQRAPARAVARRRVSSTGARSSGAPTSCSSTGQAAATATTTRRGSSTATSASSIRVRAAAVTEEGILAA